MSVLRDLFQKFPNWKEKLLRLNDRFHVYRQILVGHLVRYPFYFLQKSKSEIIAKPGTLGFKGGVFNPGAIDMGNEILLLARTQVVPWFKARGTERCQYLVGDPVVFLLDRNTFTLKKEYLIKNLNAFPAESDVAVEDFRLFTWQNRIMVNHSVVMKEKIGGHINQGSVYPGLSVLEEGKILKFIGAPKLDFQIGKFEKNWMYKESGDELFLFYSVNPYRVLVLKDKVQMKFETVINEAFDNILNDPGRFGSMVSLSSNPIDFDERHWLMVIHQIDQRSTGRCYFHWAVLIDKTSLLPAKITKTPIFNGMGARGRTPGIRYISSLLKIGDEILFFAGEGDVFVTVAKRKRSELESLFVNLQ